MERESIKKGQGYMSKNELVKYIRDNITNPNEYEFYIKLKDKKVYSITVAKSLYLGKNLNENSYSFLHQDYDRELFVLRDFAKHNDFICIAERNFNKINFETINGFDIISEFDIEIGDKNSCFIEQLNRVNFSLKITKENAKIIVKTIRELVKFMG